MKKIDISVIIPSFNNEKTIEECVSSVLKNDYEKFEVIVVDDKSTDGTKEIVKRLNDGRVRLIVNRSNSGSSFSRNRGIRMSKGEIILLLDSDSYVEKDWIKRHITLHRKIKADIIGGGIVGIHKTPFGKADGFSTWFTSIPYSKDFYLKKLHLPTNNMSIKRRVFKKVGYLNESLKQAGEDSEFCFRALKNGLKIYFKSDLAAYHHDREGFKGFIRHQEHFGNHAVKMRREMKMDYSFLMPKSYFMAYLYILPLSCLYTCFIIRKWVIYEPSVLLYSPLIFLGKLKQAIAIKDSFRNKR